VGIGKMPRSWEDSKVSTKKLEAHRKYIL